MERRFARVVLACASTALVATAARAADPVIAPLDLSALHGALPQQSPAVAFDGASFLVVWEQGSRIWGARLEAGGAVLGGPFPIAHPADGAVVQLTPAVAAGSDGFLVAWTEDTGSALGTDVRGARVSSAGAVFPAAGFDVSVAPGRQEAPAIAAGGAEFLVVWQDDRADAAAPDVFGARVDATGTVLDPAGLPISQRPSYQRAPAVAWNGVAYLVAWGEAPIGGEHDVWGARVSPEGLAAELVISAAPGDQLGASVASNGSGFLVAWNDRRTGSWQLAAARVGAAAVLDPDGIILGAADDVAPHVASSGTGYLVAYERTGSGALATRLREDGVAGAELTLDATDVVASGQAVAFGSLGRHVEVHREAASGAEPRLAAALVTTFDRLTVTLAGTGTGSVTSAPPGIACGATCGFDFATGALVVLTAAADPGSSLASWSGCGTASAETCAVTVLATTDVTATFTLELPGMPGTPAFADVGTTSLVVSWAAAARADGYDVERATSAGGPFTAVATGLAGLSHAESGLARNARYWYRIRATNAWGAGPYSPEASVVTAPDAPGGPTFAAVEATSLTVSWTPPADGGAARYDLDRASAAAGPWTSVAPGTSALGHVDSGLTAGATYWYRVRALNEDGLGGAYATASVSTVPGAAAAPAYPSVGATSVTVSWAPVAGATRYTLERSPDPAGTWTPVAADVPGTTQVDSALAPNATWWYRVRASNASGAGAPSPASSVTTLPGAPGAPSFGAVGASSVTLTWAAPDGGAATYKVARAPDAGGTPGSWTEIAAGVPGTTLPCAGLSPNTRYWFHVIATNASGDGAPSEARSVTTGADAPGTPSFGSVATTSVLVSWIAPEGGASGYDVERALDDGGGAPGPWTQVATAHAATSYPSAGLAKNTRYWYRVRALNAAGPGPYSPAASVTTLPDAPGAPAFSGIGTTSLTVSWTPPADGGAARYDLERATAAAGPWTARVTGTAGVTWADAGLVAGVTYWYRVRGTNADGLPGEWAAASATTLPAAAPAPSYSGVGATALTVTWTAVAGATSYDVERGPSADGPWTAAAVDVGGTTYLDPALSPNVTYWYRVRGTGPAGDGAFSPASSVTTLPDAPGAPGFGAVDASSVTLGWAAPAGGARDYEVERATASAGPWTRVAGPIVPTTWSDGGLASNATYWYRVRAANVTGAGAYSPASSVTTLPGAPTALAFGSVTETTLTVSWTAPAGGAATYDLERATASGGPFTAVATAIAALAWPDSGLLVGTTYWYRVRANAAGGTGAYSAAQVITLPGVPGTPAFTAITASSVTLSWAAAAGAGSYVVERATDGGAGVPGPWAPIAPTVAGTTYVSGGLSPNVRYWYRVRATNASGSGGYSPEASVVTLPAPPGAPAFSNVTETSLTVSWAAPAGGAASYDLQRGTTGSDPWTPLAVATTARSFADSGLAAGTTYWYRVRATNATGLSSAWVAGSAPTLPAAPGAPLTSVTVTSVTVSWSPVTGATGYRLERAPGDLNGATGAWAEIAAPTAPTTSYDDGGRPPNTIFWYRVRATNASGAGAYSPATRAVTLPGIPEKPTFSSVTSSGVTVSWTAPSGGAASYDLQRATSALGPWTSVGSGVTELSRADTGLSPGTTYWYHVRAVTWDGGVGAWSQPASVTTLPAAPGAPTFSAVSALSLTVRWTAIAGATRYDVERAPDLAGRPGGWVVVAPALGPSEASYVDATAPNTTYWYRVLAANASGTGEASPAAAKTTLPLAPGAPAFTSVTSTGVTLNWSAPSPGGAESYVVERATSPQGPWAVVATGVEATSHADAGLSPATTYWYAVRGANVEGATGTSSPIATITTLPGAPSTAPGVPTYPSVGTSSVTVAWAEAAGAAGYTVERAADAGGAPGAWVEVATSIAARTWADAGLAANTAYWYRVRGSTAGGDGPWSAASPVTTLPNAPGAAPTFASVTTTGVTVAWTEPAGGAARYVVERAAFSSGPWTVVAPAVAGLTHPDAGLSPATTYWYRVRATNAAGASGAPSPAASVTTLPPAPSGAPGAPTFSSVGTTTVTFGWTAATGATRYDVERAADAGGVPGAWAPVASVTVRTWTDPALAPNTTYWYRVRGATAGGEGAYSTASGVVTLPNAPGAPAFASIAATSVAVSWAAPLGGAASYDLERGLGAAGPWTATIVTATASHVDSGLGAATTYWYRVRARNAAGAAGDWSPSASVATSSVAPGAPGYLNVGVTSLTVYWTAAPGAASYRLERGPTAGGAWTQLGGSITATSWRDATGPNATYWYRVCAVSAAGAAGACSAATTVTTLPGAPGAPTFGSVAATTLTVGWTAPAGGAATYTVERAATATGPWTARATGVATLTHVETGLTPNTTYHYRVRAANVLLRDGAWSASASVTTAPDGATRPPGPISAPTYSDVTTARLVILWTAATDAARYDLERAADASGAPAPTWTHVASTASLVAVDSGRAANTRYWYRVRASNGGGSSASPPSSVTTAPNVPGLPTFSSIGATSVTVSWTAPGGGAASYDLERGATALGPWVPVATAIPATTRVDAPLAPATTYYYRVRARNAAGLAGATTAWRAVATLPDASAPVPGIPGAPTFTRVLATSVTVSWTAAANATVHEVERSSAAAGPWMQVAAVAGTTVTDYVGAAHTTFWYRVRGSNGAAQGAWSPARSVTTAPNAPPAPTLGPVGATAVTVSWSAPAGGAATYQVERATAAGTWTQIADGIAGLTWSAGGLAPNTAYAFRVRALNAAGVAGLYSPSRSATTLPDSGVALPGAPGAPTYASIGATTLKVAWAPAAGATSYRVDRATSSAGPWLQVAATAATGFTDTGRSANTRYWYRVCGRTPGGDGPYSPAVAVTTAPNAPGPPTFTAIGPRAVSMTWAAPAGGAATYALDRAPSAIGPWTEVAAGLATPGALDGALVPNTTYYYRVRAASDAGTHGLASYTRSVLTAPDPSVAVPPAPGTPAFSSVGSGSVTVGWAPAAGATSYRLERAGASSGPWTEIARVAATSHVDGSRAANTVYWYRVRGANAGGDGPYSAAARVTTAPNAPGAPVFGSVGATGVVVSWTAPPGGAARYTLERRPASGVTWTAIASGTEELAWPDVGLAPATTYSYRVVAANADGVQGPYSASRAVTTAAADAVPGT